MSWNSSITVGLSDGESYSADCWGDSVGTCYLRARAGKEFLSTLATFTGTRDQLRELVREMSAAIAMLDADAEPEPEPEPEPERKPEDCGYVWEDRTKNHHACGLPPNHSGEHVCRFSAYQLYSGHCQATAPQKLAVRGPRHELF